MGQPQTSSSVRAPEEQLAGVSSTPSAAKPPVDGFAALARALRLGGVDRIFTVPGSPASSLADAAELAGIVVEDLQNEKAAAEAAFGYAWVGGIGSLLMKGNGTLVAAEPLDNAGPHGSGALLVIVGDDTCASSSTVPTDARRVARCLDLPVIEPIDGASIDEVIRLAIDLSLDSSRPVFVRFTKALAAIEAPAATSVPELRARRIAVDRVRVHQLTKESRYRRFRQGDELVQTYANRAPIGLVEGQEDACFGIVVGGALWSAEAAALAPFKVPQLGLTMSYPLPEAVFDLARTLPTLLVLEEGTDVIEQELILGLVKRNITCVIRGQRSGHVPLLGPRDEGDVVQALKGGRVRRARLAWKEVTERPSHEYELLFDVLRDVRATRQITLHSCVGSSITAAYPPWQVMDTALNLGGATGVALGASFRGEPAIAIVGDYGVLHSAASAHDQAYELDARVLTVVLANGVSGKTGGHPAPTSPTAARYRPVDLRRVLTRVAPEPAVVNRRIEDLNHDTLLELVLELLDSAPSTLVLEAGVGTYHAEANVSVA
jgi:indolepyruvate ferredoxin oxidoreductase alpha subunit